MDASFQSGLQAMIDASDGRIAIASGDRDTATQQRLWDDAVAKYGPDEARNWVAPPGNSNHEKGIAADLSFTTSDARQWAHDHAQDFGLWFPLSNEEWHVEPLGSRSGPVPSGAPRTSEKEVVSDPVLKGPGRDPFAGVMSFLGIASSPTGDPGDSPLDLIPALKGFSTPAATAQTPQAQPSPQGQPSAPSTEGSYEEWVSQIAKMKNLTPEETAAFRQLGQAESGGQNIWQQIHDVNTDQGDPAFGPWQVIGGTFNGYKEPGYEDRFDPVASGLAAVNYMRARYGRILSKAGY